MSEGPRTFFVPGNRCTRKRVRDFARASPEFSPCEGKFLSARDSLVPLRGTPCPLILAVAPRAQNPALFFGTTFWAQKLLCFFYFFWFSKVVSEEFFRKNCEDAGSRRDSFWRKENRIACNSIFSQNTILLVAPGALFRKNSSLPTFEMLVKTSKNAILSPCTRLSCRRL